MLGWVAGLRLTGRDEYALRSCVAVEWSGGRAVVVGSCVDMELAIVGSAKPSRYVFKLKKRIQIRIPCVFEYVFKYYVHFQKKMKNDFDQSEGKRKT
jgi:hypothetical protein